ncbi:MAG: AIPR family protein [Cylindrospermopsis raciborskii KL1]|uniref:AIPR family protein n=2 Tax=Cylindrospermopsis raciborskii TaxID=77022 RepID=UPI001A1B781E|nr:AIPR family protein [Cylindrospermopsis raciborskii]MBG0744436.1 AIPR family protein [Cylindrospermopsis raciborskii KL1]
MNIEVSIIDQRLVSVVDAICHQARKELGITDQIKLKSLSFVYLCVKTILDLDHEIAFDCLTEGGGDFGVDAIHISEEHDGEFTVSLFQGKYKDSLEGNANFPETGIVALINAISVLFNPNTKIEYVNARLLAKVEEVRGLIRDGYIPQIRALACNNGLKWNQSAQEAIDRKNWKQVTWEHVDPERLIKILQGPRPVDDYLQLNGKALVEDMNFSRVLVGRIAVTEIATLMERHGERLLDRNIRRYLGLQGNRVNADIAHTLNSEDNNNFYFYNNGVTLICDKFSYNALQDRDYKVKVENLQIINGGQTCVTIFRTLTADQLRLFGRNPDVYVLIRLYQLPSENEDLVKKITYATNSQNPVDLRDLRANDEQQQKLEIDLQQLGFSYRRKRSDSTIKSTDITATVAAGAVLAVWREKPHQAKFFAREHFGKLYDDIFAPDLNGTQVVIAVLLYRIAENRCRQPERNDPEFVRYASFFIAMQMGKGLLNKMKIKLDELNHRHFDRVHRLIQEQEEELVTTAIQDIEYALNSLYGGNLVSLQQLSATFRRGDLLKFL